MSSHLIKWLKEVKKKDISIVGGKAANLGEMFSNFPIPDGFCITVSAFEEFLEEAGIKNKLMYILKGIDTNNLEKIESISKEIRNLIIKSKIP